MKQLKGVELRRFKRKLPKHTLDIVVVLENIQYASNVASIFRTSDASKVKKLYLTGISKTPPFGKDLQKASRSKEKVVPWEFIDNTGRAIQKLRKQGYKIVALEITESGNPVTEFVDSLPSGKIAIILGNEAQGISKSTLEKVDAAVYIPMFGKGASLNVSTACAVLVYSLILFSSQ